jgi:hypothetical protein
MVQAASSSQGKHSFPNSSCKRDFGRRPEVPVSIR